MKREEINPIKNNYSQSWSSEDAAILHALQKGKNNPIDWADVILNIFYLETNVICYWSLLDSVKKMVAKGLIIIDNECFILDPKFETELKSLDLPNDNSYGTCNIILKFLKSYPLYETKNIILPSRIISIEEFENGINRFYNHLEQNSPELMIPRMLDFDRIMLDGISADPSYGYTSENPININGSKFTSNYFINKFFESIIGYEGNLVMQEFIEKVESPNDANNYLDCYAVWYLEQREPVFLYFNRFKYSRPFLAPMGFFQHPPSIMGITEILL